MRLPHIVYFLAMLIVCFSTQDFEREGVRNPDSFNDIYNFDAFNGSSFFNDFDELQTLNLPSSYSSTQIQQDIQREVVEDNASENVSHEVSHAQGYQAEPIVNPTVANVIQNQPMNDAEAEEDDDLESLFGGLDEADVVDQEPAEPYVVRLYTRSTSNLHLRLLDLSNAIANPTVANNVQSQPMSHAAVEEDDDLESLFGGFNDTDVQGQAPAEPYVVRLYARSMVPNLRLRLLDLSNTTSPPRKKRGRKSEGQENEQYVHSLRQLQPNLIVFPSKSSAGEGDDDSTEKKRRRCVHSISDIS